MEEYEHPSPPDRRRGHGATEPKNEERPSLEALSLNPERTHRNWWPKYGRVQKCDWCNGRSKGTLHVCTTCSLRMCEDCARNRIWHANRTHFIDADTLDWVMKKIPRVARATATKVTKKPQAKRPASPDLVSTSASRHGKKARVVEEPPQEEEGDNSFAEPLSEVAVPARQIAAETLLALHQGINHQDGNNYQDQHQRHTHSHEQTHERAVFGPDSHIDPALSEYQNQNKNVSAESRSDFPAGGFSFVTDQDREHDRIVMRIYEAIYGPGAVLDPYRRRTRIPKEWNGRQHITNNPYDHVPGGYEYSSRPSESSTHRSGFSGQYHPSEYPTFQDAHNLDLRHEHTIPVAKESENSRYDRQIRDDMCDAWERNSSVFQLAATHGQIYALEVLWEVFELRRLYLPEALPHRDSLAVCWFVDRRNRLKRNEMEPTRLPQMYERDQHNQRQYNQEQLYSSRPVRPRPGASHGWEEEEELIRQHDRTAEDVLTRTFTNHHDAVGSSHRAAPAVTGSEHMPRGMGQHDHNEASHSHYHPHREYDGPPRAAHPRPFPEYDPNATTKADRDGRVDN
ncbi:uncharacterized protein C8A04DRAFT_29092 [Dichotomopilus funicola]|uniref:Uncharacterized protein n=1 Tax=Dichotomopilus funicola TaxID=1934379 RepID=A0AAN6ZMP1_9PEZI|nr:hypothetical protein C8A04DRAFT_29092 [Dichotomopilus funicola]